MKNAQELKQFAKYAADALDAFLEPYHFLRTEYKVDKDFINIIYKRGPTNYIQLKGSIHPLDAPSAYNIVLGDGSTEWPENDWNCIALWRLKKYIAPTKKIHEYSMPTPEGASYSLTNALKELIEYGHSFLAGDLRTFLTVRSEQNKEREPYKIHTPTGNGEYSTTNEPQSEELKKKFS